LDASYAGFQSSDNANSLAGSLGCDTDHGLLHAGDHPIKCAGQTSKDYVVNYVAGVLSVARKAIVGQVANDTIVYGTPVRSLPVTYLGLVGDDTAEQLTLPTAGCTDLGAKPSVGDHPVSCDARSTDDYDVTYLAGALTVTKASLVVKADDASMTYGDTLPALSGKIVTGTGDATVTGSISCSTDSGVLHAGPHPISCSGLSSDNFDIAYQPGTLTVGKAQLAGQVASHTISYGDDMPSFALDYTGFKHGDAASSLGLPSSCTGPSGTVHAGTYDVKCGEVSLDDYDVSVTGGTLTVQKAPLTLQTDTHAITYGRTIPQFGVTYHGFVHGEDASVLGGSLSCDTPSGVVAVGTYPVTCNGLTSADYDITFTPGSLTVSQAELLVAAKNATMTYGDKLPKLTADVTGAAVQDGDASITGTLSCGIDTATPHAGTHTVTCSGLHSPNYAIKYVDATLTVLPAPLVGTTNSATITYGEPTPDFAPVYSGFVNSDTAASLTGTVSCDTPTGAVHAGSYQVHCNGQTSDDYAVSYRPGTLTVNPAALTGQTSSQTMTYGQAVPGFGVSYSGFQNGDGASTLTGSLSCNAPTAPHVGSYQVTCNGQTSNDYLVSYSPGTLTVNRASLTGTVSDKSITYGASVPTFGVTYTGLAVGDTAAGLGLPATCPAPATAHAGSYTISCPATATDDYTVGYLPGTLTVNPATATVTAPTTTRPAGQPNPTLTPSYTGWVNGDTASVLSSPATCTTTATASSPAGSYPINCSGAAAHDYTFGYVAGTLTVKVNMQIKAFSQPINDPPGTQQSVVKGGSTVPVKFQITDPSGNLLSDSAAQTIADQCTAKISYGFVSSTVGAANESTDNTTPTAGACFRYDAAADQFIYNLSTKSMAVGTWTIRATATLPDGSLITHEVNVGIR